MVTRILIKKTLRDIRSQWAQFLSVFVMAALTMLVFVGITSAGYGMQRSLNDYNASSAPADAWLTGKDITDDDLDAIRGMDTVSQAQAGITTSASIKDTSEGHDDPSVELNAVDRADIPKLDRIEGSAFPGRPDRGRERRQRPQGHLAGRRPGPRPWMETRRRDRPDHPRAREPLACAGPGPFLRVPVPGRPRHLGARP